MKKILLIDDSDTYTWCLQKYLQHRGYPVKTACTLKEARTAIQEEMPLVVCCDLDLPDGSGMDFLDEVRAADKELPFILASCHDKDDYEQEAMRRGATLCMDKMKGLLLQDKLVEYAYRQLSGEKAPTFHKLLFVYAEDTSAEVLRAAMLQKGFDLILVSSIWEAKRRIFEDKEIELILCDLELPDGTAMELFHTLRRVAGMFQMKNPPVRLLPFFILTENNDLATEYKYRHEGVNDYITAPVNIPELIRRGPFLMIPAFSSALNYFYSLTSADLPANLVQAQRDYFGAHTFERKDELRGQFFHENWTGHGGETKSGTYNV